MRRRELKDVSATISGKMPPNLQQSVAAASKKGALTWLTTIPIEKARIRSSQRDVPQCSCTEIWLAGAVLRTACGSRLIFEPDHQLICRQGGYISLHHNELHDLIASLLKEVCIDVSTELLLQPVTGKNLPTSSNTTDSARLDVWAKRFEIEICRMHSLIPGFFIPMHPLIEIPTLLLCTVSMRQKRKGSMEVEYVKLNMGVSRHWF